MQFVQVFATLCLYVQQVKTNHVPASGLQNISPSNFILRYSGDIATHEAWKTRRVARYTLSGIIGDLRPVLKSEVPLRTLASVVEYLLINTTEPHNYNTIYPRV